MWPSLVPAASGAFPLSLVTKTDMAQISNPVFYKALFNCYTHERTQLPVAAVGSTAVARQGLRLDLRSLLEKVSIGLAKAQLQRLS